MTDISYFQNVRTDIEPLLKGEPKRILDVGCGVGATLNWLKRRWPAAETVGVDGYAPILPELEKNVDQALILDLEKPLPELGKFDLVMALDVLEHLSDPWTVAKQLSGLIEPGGALLVSVPNVANRRVLVPLLLRGEFKYTDAGVLDRTHLRFFDENSAVELVEATGLTVTAGVATMGRRQRAQNLVSLGLLRRNFITQFLMRAERNGERFRKWMYR
jgi:2-polyprenyl-3-methyl-5-hydroxy-6-metoxy-1,4-benzoquinol methylase